MNDLNEFVERYVALWNEPDVERRRSGIRELWADDAVHFTSTLEARGYGALEQRIASAHEKFVTAGGFRFKSLSNAVGHHGILKFNWVMVPAIGGAVAAAGSDVFILGDDGRISVDYQFTEPLPVS